MTEALLMLVVFCAVLGIAGMISESETTKTLRRASSRWLSARRRRADAYHEYRVAKAWESDSERGFWGC